VGIKNRASFEEALIERKEAYEEIDVSATIQYRPFLFFIHPNESFSVKYLTKISKGIT
jgi:hypothetical protein